MSCPIKQNTRIFWSWPKFAAVKGNSFSIFFSSFFLNGNFMFFFNDQTKDRKEQHARFHVALLFGSWKKQNACFDTDLSLISQHRRQQCKNWLVQISSAQREIWSNRSKWFASVLQRFNRANKFQFAKGRSGFICVLNIFTADLAAQHISFFSFLFTNEC